MATPSAISTTRACACNCWRRSTTTCRPPCNCTPATIAGRASRPAPKPATDKAAFTGKADDRIEHNGLQLALKWDLDALQLDSITAFDTIHEKAESPNMSIYEFGRGYNDDRWKEVSQELRLSSAKNQAVSWIVGTHLFHEQLDSHNSNALFPEAYNQAFGVADFGRTDIDQKTDSFALFASSTWPASDALSLTAGLRWTRETKDIDLRRVAAPDAGSVDFSNRNDWWKHYSGPLVTRVEQDEQRTWNKLTYDFTPEYQLNDNARAVSAVGRRYRPRPRWWRRRTSMRTNWGSRASG